MVYSSYVFLLHVPFLSHAHNLYMQLAIEQGVPGLLAFVTMVLVAILGLIDVYRHGNQQQRIYSIATFASLTAILWHGLVEAELYAHLLRPFLFLPFGFSLILLWGGTKPQMTIWPKEDIVRATRWLVLIGILTLPIVIIILLWPRSRAALWANMGTVRQTQTELAVYRWPEWPIQDALRRNNAVELSPAIDHYSRALRLNPTNITAHRRLGQIKISMGQYEAAQQHLEIAYELAPNQRATRQMLGEIYAINGNVEAALKLWKTIDTTPGQLEVRRRWYAQIGEKQKAAWLADAIKRLEAISK